MGFELVECHVPAHGARGVGGESASGAGRAGRGGTGRVKAEIVVVEKSAKKF